MKPSAMGNPRITNRRGSLTLCLRRHFKGPTDTAPAQQFLAGFGGTPAAPPTASVRVPGGQRWIMRCRTAILAHWYAVSKGLVAIGGRRPPLTWSGAVP
jgi:hypothetical protein